MCILTQNGAIFVENDAIVIQNVISFIEYGRILVENALIVVAVVLCNSALY